MFKVGDKVVCINNKLGDDPNFIHPNGPPPAGPILCVEWAGTNESTGNHCVKIIGYPVLNWTHKILPPIPTQYNHQHFRKIVPRSERVENKNTELV